MRNIERYLMSSEYKLSEDKYYLFNESVFDKVIIIKDLYLFEVPIFWPFELMYIQTTEKGY